MPERDSHCTDITTSRTAQTAGTCIAFDYGNRRIGTAVGNATLRSTKPLAVIANRQGTPDWPAISELIEQWQPSDLVVGWPLTEDGKEQLITQHVKNFINELQKKFGRAVHRVDERYSSIEAQEVQRRMRQSGQRNRKTRRGDIDCIAAALILENWFSATPGKS
ncbi:MAG: Holliday junction resolvase RuvX [Granulosicoccus sp.]|nr:Holliday junction resolvase RuvX [Granulosicoccus sp.]